MLHYSGNFFAQVGTFYPFVPFIFLLFLLTIGVGMWKSASKQGFGVSYTEGPVK
jgi:hypothetical protein